MCVQLSQIRLITLNDQMHYISCSGHLSVKKKNKLSRLINAAERVIFKSQKQLCIDVAVHRKVKLRTADASHYYTATFRVWDSPVWSSVSVPSSGPNHKHEDFYPLCHTGIEHRMTVLAACVTMNLLSGNMIQHTVHAASLYDVCFVCF